MSEFWLWFVRPIAEMLGVMAMLLAFGVAVGGLYAIAIAVDKLRDKRKAKR